MWADIEEGILYILSNAHFLIMQGGAIIGAVCALMMVNQEHRGFRRHRVNPGVVLGIAAFFMAYLVWASGNDNPSLHLRTGLAFLAGVLGGALGGATYTGLMLLAMRMFSGDVAVLPITLDMAIVAATGVGVRHWLRSRSTRQLRWSGIVVALSVQLLAGLLTPLIVSLSGLIDSRTAHGVIALRIAAAPITLLLLLGIFGLMKWEGDRREQRLRKYRMSLIDPFTGFPNRVALRKHLKKLARNPDDSHRSHTLVLIEVSNLGDLIVVHGQPWADAFWRWIESLIRRESSGAFLRIQRPRLFVLSDAFLAVVLHDISVAEAQRTNLLPLLSAKLDRWLRAEHAIEGGPFPRLQYGVAELQGSGRGQVDEALRNLNLALRSAEEKIGYFMPSLPDRVVRDSWLRQRLAWWIREQELPPIQYQPKVDLGTGRIVGAEALLRMHDEGGEPIRPGQVLRMAVQQQLMAEFEWCTLRAAVQDLLHLQALGRIVPFSVNISAASLETGGFAPRLVRLLETAGVAPDRLVLELTEQQALPDRKEVRVNMQLLYRSGIRLSLDDFGTGYSALALLAQYPFSEVKINRSMVARLAQPRMRVAISLALESAQRYRAELVAEGIETRQEAETLVNLGVRHGQGFLYGRAMPLSALMHLKVAQDEAFNTSRSAEHDGAKATEIERLLELVR
ncbi:MAG: bifunctional diguanylate cyclase/phosphodiesterase [Xanthomonadaceae bacterium]|jgi:EAL domain-containing protein (putative c-di-GMP-specific phosphodiesterase class I)/GGDEF domain-containing protein|nr:bifunctional diguanylate cyclase/phosphodiesterase [Xanthomonadaceae bacterium]